MLSHVGSWSRMRAGARYPRLALVLKLTIVISVTASTAVQAETLLQPTGSRMAREEAVRSIPFNALRADAAREIRSIVNEAALYRRLPVTSAHCGKDLFVFWVRNPDVIVGIWEAMGVTELSVQRTGQFAFQACDGAGTTSALELVYGTSNLHLYRGTGYYEGPLLKRRIRGDCVVLLRSEFRTTGASPTPQVISRIDIFVALEQTALELAAKTLQPLFVRYADLNFVETTDFVERLYEAALHQGERMSTLAHRLEKVSPAVQYEFARLAAKAAHETY